MPRRMLVVPYNFKNVRKGAAGQLQTILPLRKHQTSKPATVREVSGADQWRGCAAFIADP